MDDVAAALAEQHAELATMTDGLSDAQWALPSACAGWDVADVLLHLAQTDAFAVASLGGRLGEEAAEWATERVESVNDLAGRMVEEGRGDLTGGQVRDLWRRTSEQLRDALRGVDPSARVQWVAGELAARTLATTRIAECWIHTNDMAVGLGAPHPPSDRIWHIARLAWRTLPYAFAHAGRTLSGPVAFRLDAPDGTTWEFGTDDDPVTVVTGPAVDLVLVAGQRWDAADTGLRATGPDATGALELVRTFA